MPDLSLTLEWPNLTENKLKKYFGRPDGQLAFRMERAGQRVAAAARIQVGKVTGGLAASIHHQMRRAHGLPEVIVGSDNRISLIHHEGTRPHAIKARNAEFLRFSSNGRIVYDRAILHPGTKPNRYLTDNIYLARL